MKIMPTGYFQEEWDSAALSKGLRPVDTLSRNNPYLTVNDGMVGIDGSLITTPDISISTVLDDVLIESDNFPFPQLFTTESLLIVCNEDSILELVDGALVSKLSSIAGGGRWAMGASDTYVYLSNGTVVIVRDPFTGVYSYNTELPIANAICNYNGQFLVGAPKDQ